MRAQLREEERDLWTLYQAYIDAPESDAGRIFLEIIAGLVFEPLDWLFTARDLMAGDITAAIGFLPFFSSGMRHADELIEAFPQIDYEVARNFLRSDSLIHERQTKLRYIYNQIATNWGEHPLRKNYEKEIGRISLLAEELIKKRGDSDDALWIVARSTFNTRREITKFYKELTPLPLRDYIYRLNDNFRVGYDQYGLTWEGAIEKYKNRPGSTPLLIIEAASRTNPDVNKFLIGFEEWFIYHTGDRYINYNPIDEGF